MGTSLEEWAVQQYIRHVYIGEMDDLVEFDQLKLGDGVAERRSEPVSVVEGNMREAVQSLALLLVPSHGVDGVARLEDGSFAVLTCDNDEDPSPELHGVEILSLESVRWALGEMEKAVETLKQVV